MTWTAKQPQIKLLLTSGSRFIHGRTIESKVLGSMSAYLCEALFRSCKVLNKQSYICWSLVSTFRWMLSFPRWNWMTSSVGTLVTLRLVVYSCSTQLSGFNQDQWNVVPLHLFHFTCSVSRFVPKWATSQTLQLTFKAPCGRILMLFIRTLNCIWAEKAPWRFFLVVYEKAIQKYAVKALKLCESCLQWTETVLIGIFDSFFKLVTWLTVFVGLSCSVSR